LISDPVSVLLVQLSLVVSCGIALAYPPMWVMITITIEVNCGVSSNLCTGEFWKCKCKWKVRVRLYMQKVS